MKNYYAILGVAPSAEEIVIRAAWKALAQRYHPDRFAGDIAQAHTRMAEINEAYNVLSNPVQRQTYDRARADKRMHSPDGMHEENAGQTANGVDQFEKDWALAVGVQSNFGDNPEIIALARQLMFEGNKAAAKALNDSIRELSSNVPAEWIINRICEDFNIETKDMWKRRLRREAKARENAVWEKVREKARAENAQKEENSVAPDPAPPRQAGVLHWHWQNSFLTAVVVVVLFIVMMIGLFSKF